jgi:type I restriction enzyme M protein
VKKFARTNIVGVDLNPNLVKAAKMNMVMNNDGAGGLYQSNSLARPATWDRDLAARNLAGKVDLLFTNPPFGSKIPVDEPAIIEQFELGHSWTYSATDDRWFMQKAIQRSQPPEILFIELCVRLVKPGTGRLAIVVPDGILGSPGLGYVRQWILRNTRVLASIDLHPDTFQPSVSVQTSVLVLLRKAPEEIAVEDAAGRLQEYSAFMALANRVGHDKRGHAMYVRDALGNEVVEEIDEEVRERVGGRTIHRRQRSRRKVVDDTTPAIAEAFREWLASVR